MPKSTRRYSTARLNDRAVDELIGIAAGITADGIVNLQEAKFLYKWMVAERATNQLPLIAPLFCRIQEMLAGDHLSDIEAKELLDTLQHLSGSDYELGEAAKSTTLPLCNPAPPIEFEGKRFCFTGTFTYGNRKLCEQAASDLGASSGSVSKKTDYVVIGAYATSDWIHKSYGRKIEQAAVNRANGLPVAIVSEMHWLNYL